MTSSSTNGSNSWTVRRPVTSRTASPKAKGEYEITVTPDTVIGNTFVSGEQTEVDCGPLCIELLRDQVLQNFSDDCDSG